VRWVGPETRAGNSEIVAKLLMKRKTRRDVFGDPDIEEEINSTTILT